MSLFAITPGYAKNLSLEVPEKNYGISGQFTLKDSIEGGKPYLSSSVTFKPNTKDYWYLKGVFRHNFDNEDHGFKYSWGLGYDNWRKGTFTVQLNNYEVLEPGDGLKIDKAIASIGYKIKSNYLKEAKLSSVLTLSKRVKGGEPTLSTSLQWAPKKYWFIKGILVKPLDGSNFSYNYLFGYDDWHPGTFGFEYSNYESNPIGETNFKKGRLAITYKWKFK